MTPRHTFSILIATKSFLAAGELDDVNKLSIGHMQVLRRRLLYAAIRIHHHGVQCRKRPLILGNNNYSVL